jgi:hypothetical protein
MHEQMKAAINYIQAADKVKTRGNRAYTQVAQRVEALRLHFPELSLVTEVMKDDGEIIQMRATLSRTAMVHDAKDDRLLDFAQLVLATGWAEEVRGSSQVNKTSALENCETSAIGRCLAAFGLHGGEYASSGEVEHAVAERSKPTITQEQCTQLIDLMRDGGKTDDEIEDYRKSLRIARWADLTVERFERIYAKIEAALSREYAEGEAASANGRDA